MTTTSDAPRAATTGSGDLLRLQQQLREAGFYRGDLDGRTDVDAALREFRFVHGLGDDATLDAATSAALDAGLRLTPTMAAILHDEPGATSALGLVGRIAFRHPDYAGALSASGRPQDVAHPVREWLALVRAVFRTDAAPELHGRLVIVGLSILVPDLADRLTGFLEPVAERIREPLDSLLSPRGLALQRSTDPQEQFRRLSSSARDALRRAVGLRLAEPKEDVVHTEHLVHGLYEPPDGSIRAICDEAGLTEADLYNALDAAVKRPLPRSAPIGGPLAALPDHSHHVALALTAAVRLADDHGVREVGTRYLFYGLLAVPGCDVAKALIRPGLDPEAVAVWIVTAGVQLIAVTSADTVPPPGDHRVQEADRLRTADDVEMLVAVLLARQTPLPLAIGLFGEWGGGKSFFMALMEELVDELADRAGKGKEPESALFCRNVAQVRFNAWHYSDTNLWASLAYRIFEGLAVGAGGADDPAEKLTKARADVDGAWRKREVLERETRTLEAQVTRRRSALADYAGAALGELRADPKLRTDLVKLSRPGGSTTTAHTEEVLDALAALDDVTGKTRTAATLLRAQVAHRRLPAVLVGVLAVVAVVVGIRYGSALAAVLAPVGVVAVALLPWLGSTVRILKKVDERSAERREELDNMRRRLAEAEAQEQAARKELAGLESGADDSDRQMLEFIRERSSSADYLDQLGLVSRVRGDFERLVKLIAKTATATGPGTGVERIVLYIDDLDRCPYPKVAEVLQAVHLLLAFDLFVVVVGVDSRWLEKSLAAYYRDTLDSPEDYLEKIFQVPFRLQSMREKGYAQLVAELTKHVPTTAVAGSAANVTPATPPPAGGSPEPGGPTTDTSSSDGPHGGATRSHVGDAAAGDSTAHATSGDKVPERRIDRAALDLTDAERELLGGLGRIVRTPRSAKRLVNVYRMLRVSVKGHELRRFTRPDSGEYRAVLLLLAVLVGRPQDARQAFALIMSAPLTALVWDVLAVSPVAADLADVRALQHMAGLKVASCREWAPRVSRFSFRLNTVVGEPLSTPEP